MTINTTNEYFQLNTNIKYQGRSNRKRYWLQTLVMIGAFLLAMLVGIALFGVLGILGKILIVLVVLAMIYVSFCITAKRLHDRNKSGQWFVPFFVLPNILSMPVEHLGEDSPLALLLLLISAALSIWAFIEVGCLKGTIGDNQYGPDSLSQQDITHVTPN